MWLSRGLAATGQLIIRQKPDVARKVFQPLRGSLQLPSVWTLCRRGSGHLRRDLVAKRTPRIPGGAGMLPPEKKAEKTGSFGCSFARLYILFLFVSV